MKNNIYIVMLIAALGGCQKPVDSSSGGLGSNISTPSTDSVKLCSDGTLNCMVKLPPNTITLPVVAFETCVKQCLADAGCSTAQTAPQSCSSDNYSYEACSDQCDVFGPDGSLASLPASDELKLPDEPRKAFEVHIEACFDSMALTEVHFNGTQFTFDTAQEGPEHAKAGKIFSFATGGIGKLFQSMKKVKRVGRNSLCRSAYKNQIKVSFKPINANSVEYNGKQENVTPFSSTETKEVVCKMTHSTACGIPQEIRDEVDLRQVIWTLKKIDHLNTGINMFTSYMFVNNNVPGGTSLVLIYPFGPVPVHEAITMTVFASSN